MELKELNTFLRDARIGTNKSEWSPNVTTVRESNLVGLRFDSAGNWVDVFLSEENARKIASDILSICDEVKSNG